MRKSAYSRHAAHSLALPTALAAPPPPSTFPSAPRAANGWQHSGMLQQRRVAGLPIATAVVGALWLLSAVVFLWHQAWPLVSTASPATPAYVMAPVLVSYSYYEKDPTQVSNFEFFLAVGTHYPRQHTDVHWAFVVSGDNCSPCQGLYGVLRNKETADLKEWGIKEAWHDDKFSLVLRTENLGMDFGAHNATLEYFSYRRLLGHYKYFIFLNSSVKGPFYPAWQPPTWHWTHAYLVMMSSSIHAVSSSLVCLPALDGGGPGPRLESWAFALDQEGLAVSLESRVFATRSCKLCEDAGGIVVGGEYGLTIAQFKAGFNVATLMSKYAVGTQWQDRQHWGCNNNVHPSRAGTYDGISMHPYETLFVKSSWHVADPYTKRYSQWALQHLLGKAGTEGEFDQAMYRFAISDEAQHPIDLDEAYRPKLQQQRGG